MLKDPKLIIIQLLVTQVLQGLLLVFPESVLNGLLRQVCPFTSNHDYLSMDFVWYKANGPAEFTKTEHSLCSMQTCLRDACALVTCSPLVYVIPLSDLLSRDVRRPLR